MTALFSDEEEGVATPAIPAESEVAKAYQGGPWVVRILARQHRRYAYPVKSDPKILKWAPPISDVVTYDDPFVAEGRRAAMQLANDTSPGKGDRKYEVLTLSALRRKRVLPED